MDTNELVTANNPGFHYYGRWHLGLAATTITNGAECEFAYTGNACALSFDTSAPGMVFPIIAYWIDGAGPFRAPLDASGVVRLAPTYNAKPGATQPCPEVCCDCHLVRFMANVESGYPMRNNNWTTRRDAVKFLGAQLGRGESLPPSPSNPDTIEFLGDSITASLRLLFTASTPDGPVSSAPEANWTEHASRLLGLRAVVNGHGGQGINCGSTDGAPPANLAFPHIFEGAGWSPSQHPKVVVVYHGSNDGAFTPEQYQSYLATLRAAYPDAQLFAVVPHRANRHAPAIQAAVRAMADRGTNFLDYSDAISLPDLSDGLHLNPGGAVRLGLRLANDIQARR